MRKLKNFKCTSSQVIFERFVNDEVKTVDCECGNQATRQLSAPKFIYNSCGKNASWN